MRFFKRLRQLLKLPGAAALADRIPRTESVRDVVISAAYAVTGRWLEQYEEQDYFEL